MWPMPRLRYRVVPVSVALLCFARVFGHSRLRRGDVARLRQLASLFDFSRNFAGMGLDSFQTMLMGREPL